MIAVNIADLTRYPQSITSITFAGLLDTGAIVQAEPGRFDGGAVPFICADEQAKALVQVFRMRDRRDRQYPLRAYQQGSRGGWRKL